MRNVNLMCILTTIALLITGCTKQIDTGDKIILQGINDKVNNFLTYQSDGPDNADYWQTPAESVQNGTGDCEDYALLKAYYVSAFNSGAFTVTLDIVRVPEQGNSAHAILRACKGQGVLQECMYLDNRYEGLLTEDDKDLVYGSTVFSFNIPDWERIKGKRLQ